MKSSEKRSDHFQLSAEQQYAIEMRMDAITRYAEEMADLVGRHLMATRKKNKNCKSLKYTAEELLQLAADLRVEKWREADLLTLLPDYCEASADLIKSQDSTTSESRSSLRVLRIWFEYFGWNGAAETGSDILLGNLDQEQLLDELAAFLWRHRERSSSAEALQLSSNKTSAGDGNKQK